MRITRGNIVLLTLGTMALPLIMGAAEESGKTLTYQVDPVHTSTLFKIKHMNVSNFYGRFNTTTGSITYNEKDPSKLAFDLEVDVDSIDTYHKGRDEHLEQAEYFNLPSFPKASFKSQSAKKTGEKTYEVKGELTILGQTRPVTAQVEFTGMGAGRGQSQLIGFEARALIKRSDFGMTAGLKALSDEVEIICAIEAKR